MRRLTNADGAAMISAQKDASNGRITPMTNSDTQLEAARERAEHIAEDDRRIQARVDKAEQGKSAKSKTPMQAGQRDYPAEFPAQHLKKAGASRPTSSWRRCTRRPQYRGSDKLKDMVALITGGDSGIGRAVAVLYRARRRRRRDRLSRRARGRRGDQDARSRSEGRRCILISGRRRRPGILQGAPSSRRVEELGKLDILVNNAAFQEHVNDIDDLTDEHFDRTLKTNLYGYFYMARAAVPHMKPGSAIVMTGSVTGLYGSKELLDYSMTKGGIHAFTRSLADASHGARHPRQCGRARAGVDAAQPRRPARREGRKVRQRDADAAAGPARGDRAGLRVPGGARLLQLHHRRGAADHRRL